jgi:hypothetical protein
MKPQDSKSWRVCDNNQIDFLYFIEKQYLNDKYIRWHTKSIPLVNKRKDIIDKVIKFKGYFTDTSDHRTLKNIRDEYDTFKRQNDRTK